MLKISKDTLFTLRRHLLRGDCEKLYSILDKIDSAYKNLPPPLEPAYVLPITVQVELSDINTVAKCMQRAYFQVTVIAYAEVWPPLDKEYGFTEEEDLHIEIDGIPGPEGVEEVLTAIEGAEINWIPAASTRLEYREWRRILDEDANWPRVRVENVGMISILPEFRGAVEKGYAWLSVYAHKDPRDLIGSLEEKIEDLKIYIESIEKTYGLPVNLTLRITA